MSVLLQGLGMGLAIAAPVGPIGLLCVRRTLQAGPAIGLASGFGAATADALYGCAVAGGLTITGWLVSHSRWFSIVGAALLVWMGVGAMRASLGSGVVPASGPHAEAASHMGWAGAFASTFALTVTNPATMLGFFAVIASLGSAQGNAEEAGWLVLGVFLGSMLWWATLVTGVHRARRSVSPTVMRGIDFATGLILLCSGAWVAAHALLA